MKYSATFTHRKVQNLFFLCKTIRLYASKAFRAIVALVKIQMQLRLVKLVYLSCRFLGSKDGSREHEVGGHGNYDEIDDERKLKR